MKFSDLAVDLLYKKKSFVILPQSMYWSASSDNYKYEKMIRH